MKRLILSLPLLFVLSQVACLGGRYRFPRAVIPASPGAGDYPGSGAVVLDDRAALDFRITRRDGRDRLGVVLTHHRRLKVLTEEGLRHARVSLPVDGFSSITAIHGRAVSPNGRLTLLSRKRITRELAVPGSRGAEALGSVIFEVPGAEVGGLVEYYYERVYTSPDVVPVWVFGQELPVIRSELSVVSSDGVKLDYHWGHGAALVNKKPLRRAGSDSRERLVFVETTLPPVFPEVGSPHGAWLSPWVAVGITGAVLGNRKYRMETWEHVQERVTHWVDAVGDGGLSIEGSTVEEIYREVREELRLVDGVGLGVLQPVPPDAIAAGQAVPSRDGAAVLLHLLRAKGEVAHVALLTGNSGPPLLQGFPGLYPFVRAVVAVDVHQRLEDDPTCAGPPTERSVLCNAQKSGYAFVDPLCQSCRFGELPTHLTGGRALILTGAAPEWVDVPLDPPERNFTVTLSALKASLDGEIQGDVRVASGGYPARRTRAFLREAAFQEEEGEVETMIVAAAADLVGGDLPLSITEVRWSDRSSDEILQGVGKLESRFTKLAYDRFEVRARDLVGLAFPWAWRSLRRFPRVLQGPFWRQATATVELPAGFVVDVPEPVELRNEFGEFSAAWRIEGTSLHYWRSFVIRRQVVLPSDWARFRDFLDRIRIIEESSVGVLRTAEAQSG